MAVTTNTQRHSTAGRYRMRAQYRTKGEPVLSNWVELDVSDAGKDSGGGESMEAAWSELQRLAALGLSFHPRVVAEPSWYTGVESGFLEDLRRFGKEHARTEYGKLVELGLLAREINDNSYSYGSMRRDASAERVAEVRRRMDDAVIRVDELLSFRPLFPKALGRLKARANESIKSLDRSIKLRDRRRR